MIDPAMSVTALAATAALVVAWLAWLGLFVVRGTRTPAAERRRSRIAMLGVALQGAGFFFVWFRPEQPFARFATSGSALEIAAEILTTALAAGSVVAALASVRTLGRQWAVAARLVENHRLVREGPYRYVRHPVYSTMLGMLVATGIAMTPPRQFALSVVLFFIGFVIRIRAEEALLRTAFGAEFEQYRRQVPALIPSLRFLSKDRGPH